MADQSPAQSERELPVARYEGWYTRLGCEACGEMFEIEDERRRERAHVGEPDQRRGAHLLMSAPIPPLTRVRILATGEVLTVVNNFLGTVYVRRDGCNVPLREPFEVIDESERA